jgi:hypothetical protein
LGARKWENGQDMGGQYLWETQTIPQGRIGTSKGLDGNSKFLDPI